MTLLLAASPVAAGWEEGVAAFRAGRYKEAEAAFRAVTLADPQAAAGHYMLGRCLVSQGRNGPALPSLRRAVELAPQDSTYRLALAQAERGAGELDAALRTLGAIDPHLLAPTERPPFAQLLERIATESTRWDVATPILERAVAVDGASRPLWRALARSAEARGKPEERLHALRRIFESDPSDGDAASAAIGAAFDLAQNAGEDEATRRRWYEEARAMAERAATTAPSPAIDRLLGEARIGVQDYAAALATFDKVVQETPRDPLPYYRRARCHLALERPAAALADLDAAGKRAPDAELTALILRARGSALRHLERFDEAADAYRQAGDAAKVQEMERLAAAQRGNREWEEARAECLRKKATIEKMRAENGELRGTPAWEEVERRAAEILAACRPYLEDA